MDTGWLRELQSKFPEIKVVDLKGFVVGERFLKIWDVYPFQEVVRAFEEAVREGESSASFTEGERTFLLKLSRVGDLIVALKKDITLEVELDEIKRSVVSTLSHEIKTPLTAIKGNAEFLLLYGECSEPDAVREIYEKAGKIESILSGIRNLFSSRVSAFEWVNLRPLAEEVIASFRERAEEKGVELRYFLEDVSLPADKVLFQQLLRNLIDNALKFTEQGRVEVELTSEFLRISDTGKGIPKNFLPRIFERFVKGEGSSGSGIGLSVVKEIARFHGWKVEVESQEGKGSVFTVYFQGGSR